MNRNRRARVESSDEDNASLLEKSAGSAAKVPHRDDSEEMLQILDEMLLKLADYNETLRQRIDHLCFFVRDSMESKKSDLLRLLLSNVAKHPMQSATYATFVGLLNVKSHVFGSESVAKAMQQFMLALYEGSWERAQGLIMFMANLVNANVVTVESMLQLLNALADVCEEEDALKGRRDFHAQLVLITLPMVGRELYEKREMGLQLLIKRMQVYVKKDRNNAGVVQLLRIWNYGEMPQHESLDLLWQQILRLQRDHWIEHQIQRPYVAFDERLSTAMQHHLSVLKPPKHLAEPSIRYPRERLVFHLFELIEFPNRLSLPEEVDIERYVLEAHIRELLQLHHLERKKCAERMLAYCSTKPKLALEHCVIEVLLGEMLLLPSSSYITLNYGAIIIELCRLDQIKFTRIVALAADMLFNQLESMSVTSFDRFVNWFSHHLSNFRYQWNWQDWESCTKLPPLHPSPMFVGELLKKCIRLSYYKYIAQLVPESFSSMLPPVSDPIFKYFNVCLPGARLAKYLLDAMRCHCDLSVVVRLIEAATDLDNALKINVVVQSFLHLGCKSFTHVFGILRKYKPVLQMLITNEDSQLALLGALFEVWINNEQLKLVLSEKLLLMRILDANVIISWIFRHKEDLCKMYLWELINGIIKHTKLRLDELSDGYLGCLLLNIVQQCATVLKEHKSGQENDDTDYWYNWVQGRMQTVFFNYIDDFNLISSKLRQISEDMKDCQQFSKMIDNYLDYIR